MSGNDQPAGPPQLPPEAQAAVQQMIVEISQLVQAFNPNLTDQQVLQIAASSMAVQGQLGPVIGDAMDPEARAQNPVWGAKITNRATGEALRINALKDPTKVGQLGEMVDFAVVLGLVLTPAVRSVLASFGFTVEFFQSQIPQVVIPPN